MSICINLFATFDLLPFIISRFISFALTLVMVWAVFAPRFMFAAIFTGMGLMFWFIDALLLFTQNGYSKPKDMGKEGRDK